MSSFRPSPFLRKALVVDVVASGATAALVLFGAGVLSDRLGLPAPLLRGAGIVLVPYVAYVAWLAARREVTAAAVSLVIAANAAWTAASLILLISGWGCADRARLRLRDRASARRRGVGRMAVCRPAAAGAGARLTRPPSRTGAGKWTE